MLPNVHALSNRFNRCRKAGTEIVRAALTQDIDKRKRHAESAYWNLRAAKLSSLEGEHFEYFYTKHFGLGSEVFDNKSILDIGCGPRGSLEWATQASQRVGLDPLVDEYRELGIDDHGTNYVNSGAEDIPFDDGHFDIVTSFNSLDHVNDLSDTICEIKRVTSSGGLFLLITDVGHDPTFTEPLSFNWNVVEYFQPEFEILWEDHREKSEEEVYQSARVGKEYDHNNPEQRYGVLSAKMRRY